MTLREGHSGKTKKEATVYIINIFCFFHLSVLREKPRSHVPRRTQIIRSLGLSEYEVWINSMPIGNLRIKTNDRQE
jgi:hypothetical protein